MKRAAIALLVFLAACGGSPAKPSGALDDTTLSRANTICAQARAQNSLTPFPVKDFDPKNPKADDLPKVAAYLEEAGISENTATKLHAVAAPTSGAALWRRLLAFVDASVANNKAQIAAANAKDTTKFVQLVDTADELGKSFKAVGPKAGFDASSGCGKYFG